MKGSKKGSKRGSKVKFGNGDVLFRGVIELKMVENMGEGGVKNPKKSGDVL